MVVEACWRDLFKGKVIWEGRATSGQSSQTPSTDMDGYLNSWFSSMTCIPCSYCSFVGFSPTFAKWPLTDMMEGAVGCRVLVEGRRGEDRDRVAMTQTKASNKSTIYQGSKMDKSGGKLMMLVIAYAGPSLASSKSR